MCKERSKNYFGKIKIDLLRLRSSFIPINVYLKFSFFQLFLLRKQASHKIPELGRFYICSLSTETIVYKVRAILSA